MLLVFIQDGRGKKGKYNKRKTHKGWAIQTKALHYNRKLI
jgi:hypothetical protein